MKTPGCVDSGDASRHTSFAITTFPSAASLSPASPIHCNDPRDHVRAATAIAKQIKLRVVFIRAITRDEASHARIHTYAWKDAAAERKAEICDTFLPRLYDAFSY